MEEGERMKGEGEEGALWKIDPARKCRSTCFDRHATKVREGK